MPFKVKICGITNVSDAKLAMQFQADAIGLNFYTKSLRSVSVERATKIAAEIQNLKLVGVFVNESPFAINRIADEVGLDFVQLHGDESPESIQEINSGVIRAIRVINDDFETAHSEALLWSDAGAAGILLDAGSRTQYGGTGHHLNWEKVGEFAISKPMMLAGGLTCDNVAQAIKVAQPFGVDVASGIEKFPGSKDKDLMRLFVEAARNSLLNR